MWRQIGGISVEAWPFEACCWTGAALTAEEALAFLRVQAPDVRLALTDMVLPGRLDGIDLARVASLRWPWKSGRDNRLGACETHPTERRFSAEALARI